MKVDVTIKTTQTATLDIGNMPVNLIRDLLTKNDGTFDGNWSIGDVGGANEKWTTDSVEVVERGGKA
jgi:hypothetical protein